jgi:two-component system, cell cycle sensor histidine kinase and response regulator CckA
MKNLSILIVEDNIEHFNLFSQYLRLSNANNFIQHARTLSAAIESTALAVFDVILLDIGLPDSNDIDTVTGMTAAAPGVPIVVLTAQSTTLRDLGPLSIRAGAEDFIEKPRINIETLTRTIQFAIERNDARKLKGDLRDVLHDCDRIIGEFDAAMVQLNSAMNRLKKHDHA